MRELYEIARDIRNNWKKVSPYAEGYLEAMGTLRNIEDYYFLDPARSIVARFLCNARGFRGEAARRIKKELNDILDSEGVKTNG